MTKPDELKKKNEPCPWCEATNITVILSSDMAVRCAGCGANIPTYTKTVEEAIKRWNMRAPVPKHSSDLGHALQAEGRRVFSSQEGKEIMDDIFSDKSTS